MKKTGIRLLLLSCLLFAFLCGCSSGTNQQADTGEEETSEAEKAEVEDINDLKLRDRDALYRDDNETEVETMYLTVSQGNSSENTNHTWEELNTYSVYDYDQMGVERYQVNGLLQVGDENGPVSGQLGFGESVPNATVQVRGQTSSRYQQKNYKIELKRNKGTWNDQRTINLNKHQQDGLRFRNKLCYDLMKEIPQMLSLRTKFVHLYVKDETEGENAEFEDYGLYTQVEQLNKTGMRVHGLDSNGQLYKVNSFEFYRYEDDITLRDDPNYDLEKFEQHLEVKGNDDHTKLIEMLDAVNDTSNSITEVLDEYFDVENLTYWMAFHILTGNHDTQNRNMYLYSPLNSHTWYFISWDNDGSLAHTETELIEFSDDAAWENGVSNYWGNVLFQRCLKSDSFRNKLKAAIEDLRVNYVTKEKIDAMSQEYRRVVEPYLYRVPDQLHAPLTREQYNAVANAIGDEIEQNYNRYLESLEKPMPFFIGVPSITGDQLRVNWDVSYDFDAEDVTYTVEVASDYLFQNVIYREDNIKIPETQMDVPQPGQYFVRVRATNKSGQTQDAFDYYVTDVGKHSGMKCFYVREGGIVEEDTYEE